MYADAREFFEAVAEASRDVERVKRQLDALEQRALGMGGGNFEPRVRSTPNPDRMGAAVAAYVDREAKLHRRIESDYALIDLAHAVLYGGESLDKGLATLAPPWWADALALHYCDLMTWAEVGATLGYTEQHVQRQAKAAMETCDTHGLINVICGRGMAEN